VLRYTSGMGTSVLVSEQEYLTTSYEPDCEYDEGVLMERNVGEQPHSILETAFGSFFFERRKRFRIRALTEQRIRIAPRKYRIPDVCVYLQPVPEDPVLGTPPFIAIEILSPEDTLRAMQEKAAEYRLFGVEHIWVIDPEPRIAYRYQGSALEEVSTGEFVVPETPIRVVLSEMFAELDRAKL